MPSSAWPFTEWAAIVIFTATYLLIALGRLPGFRIDRAGIAFLGATLMVASGALGREEAYRAIDLDTIVLLFGMMIVVAGLRLANGFELIATEAVRRARHPLLLLAAVILLAGLLSAFLVNDTVCLVLTPIILETVRRLERDPRPYLLATAMASNIGSVATITGNPQNMIIGSLSHIPYLFFVRALAPVAGLGLVILYGLTALAYRHEFFTRTPLAGSVTPPRILPPLLRKTALILAALILALFAGVPPALAAALAGAFTLLTRRLKAWRFYAEVDGALLVLFGGLFVVVAGFESRVIGEAAPALLQRLPLGSPAPLALFTAVLSNVVSNVPAVLVLRPFVAPLPDPAHAWLVVAMASTLAGNFTILGSVANLIVVQRAAAAGIEIGFRTYFRLGAPITLLTLALGTLLLAWGSNLPLASGPLCGPAGGG